MLEQGFPCDGLSKHSRFKHIIAKVPLLAKSHTEVEITWQVNLRDNYTMNKT